MMAALLTNLLRLLLWPLRAFRRARAAPLGGYVTLELDGPIADLARPPARRLLWSLLRRSGRPATSVARLKELARALANDPRAAGLLVTVRAPAAGPAVLASVRDVLSEVRASGKDVVVYLPQGADNKALYLASAARLVVVGPETTVAPLGYASHGRYVRRALDRLGVEPEVFAKGTYKSAGESLIRDTMSEPQREQLGAILEAYHDALVGALAQGRRVDREVARSWIDEAPHGARRAVELGIVDAVAYDDELERLLVPGGGQLGQVRAERYLAARLGATFRPMRSRGVVGVIEVHGPIVSRPQLELARVASEERIVAALRAARASAAVRAVVLHIDSPGGGALASDRIHHEVARLAELKPVVAYLSNMAASGGYYIAAGAHRIVAQPQTVTGSIGVVSARFAVGPLLERLGVSTSVVKRGSRADLFSPSRRLDEGERAVVEREIEAFYRTFLRVVAAGRKQPIEAIEPLAEGRVYSGADAHARGLVDCLGGFDRALHELYELLGPGSRSDLPPAILRPPREIPPPARLLPAPAQAALEVLGLGPALEMAQLGLEGERVLAYWAGQDGDNLWVT